LHRFLFILLSNALTNFFFKKSVALNELFQFYYQQPPRYQITSTPDGSVKAVVVVEGKEYDDIAFSKAKATQGAANKALQALLDLHGKK
jgi:dsRNA-specific ribonuclease